MAACQFVGGSGDVADGYAFEWIDPGGDAVQHRVGVGDAHEVVEQAAPMSVDGHSVDGAVGHGGAVGGPSAQTW